MEILGAVPQSVLWLAAPPETAQERLRNAMKERGLDPERLVFAERVASRAQHLERLGLADIALDTWTYGGHSTTVDALWAGVPVVTRLGSHFPSRACASVLEAAGLAQLVASSAESYVAEVRNLASNPGRLSEIRSQLTTMKDRLSLFDGESLVRNLEASYRRIWARNIENLPPVSFDL